MSVLDEFENIPKFTIKLKDMVDPINISHEFRNNKITGGYVYRIMYKGIVIKFGMSNTKEPTPGDRVYSQLGRVKSFGVPLRRGIGNDFADIMEDFRNLYGFELDHNDIVLTIWDFTNYKYHSVKPEDELRKFEAGLIRRYIESVGERPIGNLRVETAALNKKFVTTDIMQNLFVFESV
jgi:hypothetical protein